MSYFENLGKAFPEAKVEYSIRVLETCDVDCQDDEHWLTGESIYYEEVARVSKKDGVIDRLFDFYGFAKHNSLVHVEYMKTEDGICKNDRFGWTPIIKIVPVYIID